MRKTALTAFDQIESLIQVGVMATGEIGEALLFLNRRKNQYDFVRFWDTWLPEEEYEQDGSLFASLGRQAAGRGKVTYLTHVYAIGFLLWKNQYASDRLYMCELDMQNHTQLERVYSVAYTTDGRRIQSFRRLRKRPMTVPYLRIAAHHFLLELSHMRQRQGAKPETVAELDTQLDNLNNNSSPFMKPDK